MSQPDFTVEYLDPKTLLENPHQFRRHPDSQKSALSASVKEFGWVDGPLLNKRTGNLIDGHLRRDEAIAQGRTTIPVKVVDLSEADERRLLRMFDPLTQMATQDEEALASLIAEIGDPDLERLLGELDTGGGLLEGADPDAIPEQVETRCKPGDLWRLGEHRLLCGDSTKGEDVGRLMDGESADCLFTDAPYPLTLGGRSGAGVIDGPPDGTRSRSHMFAMPAFGDWVPLLRPALSSNASLFVMSNDRNLRPLLAEMERAEAKLHNVLVMKKNTAYPHRWFSKNVEFILFHYYGTARPVTDPGRGCVFEVEMPDSEKEHPTQKPVALIAELVANVRAGLIYDPFIGSGTTLIAAEQQGRRCFGMEIDPAFVDCALARWEAATGRTATLA